MRSWISVTMAAVGAVAGLGALPAPLAGQVGGIVASVDAQGNASVRWQAVDGATRYFVVRWHTSDPACCKKISPPEPASLVLSWQDGTLPKAGTYGYRVYATTAAGTFAGETQLYYQPGVATTSEATGTGGISSLIGATSTGTRTTTGTDPVSRTVSPTALNTGPAPTNLQINGTPTAATLRWSAVTGATGYQISRAPTGGSSTVITPTRITSISFTDPVPDRTKTYTYQVSAYQADGSFGTATASFTPPAPQDPAWLEAVQTGEGQVELRWDASAALLGAKYLVAGAGVSNGITVDPPREFSVSQGFQARHTVTGLPLGTHSWTVATSYEPGGVLTPPDKWAKATMAMTARSGRYRVTMFAFEVNTQTTEGVALDGFGDEVYLAAFVATQNIATGTWGPKGAVRSLIFGDVNGASNRVLAGTASSQGGLKTGDVFPVGGGAAAPAPPNANQVPLPLWEGILADDVDLVLIAPSIWESDGNDVNYTDWKSRVDAGLTNTVQSSAIELEIRAAGITAVTSSEITSPVSGPVVDHPIGMSSTIAYRQRYFALTRKKIEGVLSQTQTIGGLAPGVIALSVRDQATSTNFGGAYTVYLRVERLP
jgi:hypothetical protein